MSNAKIDKQADSNVPVNFGKRMIRESYHEGKLHSIEITITESIDTTDTIDAQEKVVRRTMDLIDSGVARRNINVQYDLNKHTGNIKRAHLTYTTMRDSNIKTK